VAVLGYTIAPDGTSHANMQIVELAKQAPGSRAAVLHLPQASNESVGWFTRLWSGAPQTTMPIALRDDASVRVKGDSIEYQIYAGAKETRLLSDFGTGSYTTESFKEQFVRTQYFLMGTDAAGRDLFSRILIGARVSMAVGLIAVLISLFVGVLLGLLAGYMGGWVDYVIMWFLSVAWALPTLLLAIAISVIFREKGFYQLFLAIGLSMWVDIARIVRGQILTIREETYAKAAIALGYKPFYIMRKHILPNVISPIIVIAVANFGTAVLLEAGLSFLGMGVEPPMPSWGRMIFEGYTYIIFESGKWLAFFPGLALILLIMSINLVGIGLRDALDVKH